MQFLENNETAAVERRRRFFVMKCREMCYGVSASFARLRKCFCVVAQKIAAMLLS